MKKHTRLLVFVLINVAVLALIPLFKLYLQLINLSELKYFGSCLFAKLSGLYCPGCGGTRALKAMLSFDFFTAARFNLLVPLSAAIFGLCDILALKNILQNRRSALKFKAWPLYTAIFVILGYAAFRNILLIIFKIDLIGDFI